MHSKKTIAHCFLCGLLLMVISCRFSSDEELFTEIDQPTPPTTAFQLDFDKDTIGVISYAQLNYEYKADGHAIKNVKISLNDEVIYSEFHNSNHVHGNFTIGDRNLSSGFYELKMTANVSTGSGSLADKLDGEFFLYEKKWVVKYYAEVPKPKIISAREEDGSLMIKWEECSALGFDEYQLYRGFYSDISERYSFEWLDPIEDSKQAWHKDKSFVGGKAKYYLELKAAGRRAISDTITVDYPSPDFSITSNNKLQRVISWNKSSFYNNLKEVVIFASEPRYSGGTKIAAITDVNDTTFVIKEGMYPDMRYHCVMISDWMNDDYSTSTDIRKEFIYNIETDTFELENVLRVGIAEPQHIYGEMNDKLVLLDVGTGNYIQTPVNYESNIGLSGNGHYLVSGENKVDPLTYNTTKLDLKNVFNLFVGVGNYCISNNGILVGSNMYEEMIAYDVENEKPIQEITSKHSIFSPVISPDGNYIVLRGDYRPRIEFWKYNNESGLFEEISYYHGNYKNSKVIFDQSAASNFYLINDNKIEYWSCAEEKVLKSFSSEGHTLVCIDPITGYLVVDGNQVLYIYDPETGNKVREVGYFKDYYSRYMGRIGEPFALVNDVIYFDNKQLDLKNYEKLN